MFLHSVNYGTEKNFSVAISSLQLDTLLILMMHSIGSKVVWTLPSKLDGLLTEIIYSPVDTRYHSYMKTTQCKAESHL